MLFRSDADYQGNVVSNGTFSKIFGPGMRLGWMEVPARVKRCILSTAVAVSGGGFNHCISGVMESVISLGLLTQMLRESRPVYRVGQCVDIRTNNNTISETRPATSPYIILA